MESKKTVRRSKDNWVGLGVVTGRAPVTGQGRPVNASGMTQTGGAWRPQGAAGAVRSSAGLGFGIWQKQG